MTEPRALTLRMQMLFWSKSRVYILARALKNLKRNSPVRFAPGQKPTKACENRSCVISPLYTQVNPSEAGLELGKVENLRVSTRCLHGVIIPRGKEFSFWAQIGRPVRSRGFVRGRELRQGCLIPTIAGGICQLSNSLYQAARQAGLVITERHGHTAAITDAAFAVGEDATVFWNYVDLRFMAPFPIYLRCELSADQLIVAMDEICD